jgi:hypothetical protein
MMMGNYEEERKQYLEGLAIDSQNTQLLSGYGMYFYIQYSILKDLNYKKAFPLLDSAIYYNTKSYLSNSKYVPALYNLSLNYLQKNDCVNARKYYNECKLIDEHTISEELTRSINNCKTK